jgi:hypothetical protein
LKSQFFTLKCNLTVGRTREMQIYSLNVLSATPLALTNTWWFRKFAGDNKLVSFVLRKSKLHWLHKAKLVALFELKKSQPGEGIPSMSRSFYLASSINRQQQASSSKKPLVSLLLILLSLCKRKLPISSEKSLRFFFFVISISRLSAAASQKRKETIIVLKQMLACLHETDW